MKVANLTEESRSYALRPIKKHVRYPLRSIYHSNARLMKRPIVHLPDVDQGKCSKNNGHHLSKVKFLALNDNCILYVLENMPLSDLCTMAEVSVRLQQLAQFCFRLKHRNLHMKLLANDDQKITMKQVRSLFHNFGHLINSLHVSRKDFVFDEPANNPFKGQQRLLWLINKYCSLESLTLGHFWMNMNMVRDSVPMFKKLNTLNFYRVSCYCPEEKTFHHFGNVLPLILQNRGWTNRTPQIVQLVWRWLEIFFLTRINKSHIDQVKFCIISTTKLNWN